MVSIDLGCGSFKKKGYIGIDLMPHYGIDIIATAYNLPIRNHIVTNLYSSQMLEHLHFPSICLLECNRVIRMFGDLLISIPNIMHFRRLLRWSIKGKTTVASEHVYAWGLPELTHLINTFGFKYRQHGFSTHNRYHKIKGIAKLIKKLKPDIGDHNLEVRFTKWESLDG
jgi:2-polyprenyl-3-methyl-5-hydroxy-6-metoxy-1,4-benzoquinol methylase